MELKVFENQTGWLTLSEILKTLPDSETSDISFTELVAKVQEALCNLTASGDLINSYNRHAKPVFPDIADWRGWIVTSAQKPKDGATVLFVAPNPELEIQLGTYFSQIPESVVFNHGYFTEDSDGTEYHEKVVMCWMPLPEAPLKSEDVPKDYLPCKS